MMNRVFQVVGRLTLFAVLLGGFYMALVFAVSDAVRAAESRQRRIEGAASCACGPVVKGRADCEALLRAVIRRTPEILPEMESECRAPLAPQVEEGEPSRMPIPGSGGDKRPRTAAIPGSDAL